MRCKTVINRQALDLGIPSAKKGWNTFEEAMTASVF